MDAFGVIVTTVAVVTPAAATLTANGSATVSFYIDTDSIIGGDARNEGMQRRVAPLFALLSPMGLFALLAVRRRRRVSRRLLLALAVVSIPLALAVDGCGASVIIPVPSTPPGVYTIPVTGTGATTGITHAANLTLTVTP